MLKIWAYLSYEQTDPLYSNNPCERPASQDPTLSYTSETHAWLSRHKKGWQLAAGPVHQLHC